jgi:hypothetical protein
MDDQKKILRTILQSAKDVLAVEDNNIQAAMIIGIVFAEIGYFFKFILYKYKIYLK